MTTTTSTPSETSPTETGICGPALIIGLALLPVLLRKRK
ncbi:MAG TPA: CGP-CTERM sorting domain-containing protein, partial [Thermotoga sp.]|uniref:CGP-CTERM sorting domain-containing protein n=1 Tax=Thermococcus paralvinellae TaxID=582419 RepID=A0A833E066_9EURY|nr:CGP-CTERM sorting domain-containing protein [Thermococcus paralvinellae]HIP92194.1 CGP-CTERM sorting domain-containing protein [Thermotoga sp.]